MTVNLDMEFGHDDAEQHRHDGEQVESSNDGTPRAAVTAERIPLPTLHIGKRAVHLDLIR